MTPQLALLIAINRAELDGFTHFAGALRQLYALQFGPGDTETPRNIPASSASPRLCGQLLTA